MEDLSIKAVEPDPNTFFFPLRTNVQYFDSPTTRLSLEGRVKQASLLFEKLLFEAGLYHATVWEREGGGPSFDMWYPPNFLDLDKLDQDDESFRPSGGQPYVKFDNYVFASGTAERQFRAQFHGLLRKLNADSLPWIEIASFELPDEIDLKQLARDDEKLVEKVIPSASRFLRSKLSYNLNRDLILASGLQVAASLDDLFAPLVYEKARSTREITLALGFSALQVAVPDWSTLPWQEIVELRKDPSLVEFRNKMVAVERVAREAASQDKQDLSYEISQIITKELLEELSNIRVSQADVARDVTIDLVTGNVPMLGPVITGLRGEHRLHVQNESWTTAFMKLRRHV
jgi:hypothetical protein